MDIIGSPESLYLLTLNQLVLGSSPSAPTNEFKHLGQFSRTGLFAFGRLGTNWVRMQNVVPFRRHAAGLAGQGVT